MKRGILLLSLLAAGCATGQAAPISYGAATPAQSPPPPVRRAPVELTGRAAETQTPDAAPRPVADLQPAPDWAAGEGTALSDFALQPGDVQPYDPAALPRTHRVGADESLYDIATRYQVPLRALIEQNGLEPPYALSPGRELQLPPPRFHTVSRGETLQDVARRYNVDLRSLALLNRMQAPYQVSVGDRIVLPAMARAQPVVTPPQAPPPTPPRVAGNARFTMPLRGAIVGRYGAQPGGVRLDGVEIAGDEGDAVAAAADGEVVYAGSDLPAYGTLVLVRHADNYVTAYGFNRRALVREGERVRAGQTIAELGARADGRSRLLFQVRQGSSAVDPAPLLGLQN